MEEELFKRTQRHSQHHITRELGVPLDIDNSYWQLHYITFGLLFSFVSLFILLSILGLIRDDRQKKFQRRHYFLWMNLALFYFSLVMTVALLADPFEDRRYIKVRLPREALHLVIRLRLPCLGFAFSLLQLSLFNVTEVALYATWFHNIAIILIVNLVHLCLVLIASISSMCTPNATLVWLVCDLCMFLIFSGNSIISLYSVIKLILYYHKEFRCRSLSSADGCPRRATFGEEEYGTDHKIDTKPPEGEENASYLENEEEKHSNVTTSTENTDCSETNDDTLCKHDNVSKYSEKSLSSYKTCYYSGYNDRHKIITQKRRIGCLPHQIHSYKFCDKSIRKVGILMMVVAISGLVMCGTIVISISSARLFQGDHIGPWEWYALRNVRRIAEIVVTGTMAYLVRRTITCW